MGGYLKHGIISISYIITATIALQLQLENSDQNGLRVVFSCELCRCNEYILCVKYNYNYPFSNFFLTVLTLYNAKILYNATKKQGDCDWIFFLLAFYLLFGYNYFMSLYTQNYSL